MTHFIEHMKEVDLARVDLEEKPLDFERQRHEIDLHDDIRERKERRKERNYGRHKRWEERNNERRKGRGEREKGNILELANIRLPTGTP